jgi:hypothetical protein
MRRKIAAIAAAISDEARFYATGPDFGRIMTSLGKDADVFRAPINIPGRRQPLRHWWLSRKNCRKLAPAATCQPGGPCCAMTILLFSCIALSPASDCQFCRNGANGSLANSNGTKRSSH